MYFVVVRLLKVPDHHDQKVHLLLYRAQFIVNIVYIVYPWIKTILVRTFESSAVQSTVVQCKVYSVLCTFGLVWLVTVEFGLIWLGLWYFFSVSY